ncbi:hypothetical protein J2S71_000971 [Olsenella profusa DSM 13989]|nr:hypothetical protein [Olsenella profusa DSM 13989]
MLTASPRLSCVRRSAGVPPVGAMIRSFIRVGAFRCVWVLFSRNGSS